MGADEMVENRLINRLDVLALLHLASWRRLSRYALRMQQDALAAVGGERTAVLEAADSLRQEMFLKEG